MTIFYWLFMALFFTAVLTVFSAGLMFIWYLYCYKRQTGVWQSIFPTEKTPEETDKKKTAITGG